MARRVINISLKSDTCWGRHVRIHAGTHDLRSDAKELSEL